MEELEMSKMFKTKDAAIIHKMTMLYYKKIKGAMISRIIEYREKDLRVGEQGHLGYHVEGAKPIELGWLVTYRYDLKKARMADLKRRGII